MVTFASREDGDCFIIITRVSLHSGFLVRGRLDGVKLARTDVDYHLCVIVFTIENFENLRSDSSTHFPSQNQRDYYYYSCYIIHY